MSCHPRIKPSPADKQHGGRVARGGGERQLTDEGHMGTQPFQGVTAVACTSGLQESVGLLGNGAQGERNLEWPQSPGSKRQGQGSS